MAERTTAENVGMVEAGGGPGAGDVTIAAPIRGRNMVWSLSSSPGNGASSVAGAARACCSLEDTSCVAGLAADAGVHAGEGKTRPEVIETVAQLSVGRSRQQKNREEEQRQSSSCRSVSHVSLRPVALERLGSRQRRCWT